MAAFKNKYATFRLAPCLCVTWLCSFGGRTDNIGGIAWGSVTSASTHRSIKFFIFSVHHLISNLWRVFRGLEKNQTQTVCIQNSAKTAQERSRKQCEMKGSTLTQTDGFWAWIWRVGEINISGGWVSGLGETAEEGGAGNTGKYRQGGLGLYRRHLKIDVELKRLQDQMDVAA